MAGPRAPYRAPPLARASRRSPPSTGALGKRLGRRARRPCQQSTARGVACPCFCPERVRWREGAARGAAFPSGGPEVCPQTHSGSERTPLRACQAKPNAISKSCETRAFPKTGPEHDSSVGFSPHRVVSIAGWPPLLSSPRRAAVAALGTHNYKHGQRSPLHGAYLLVTITRICRKPAGVEEMWSSNDGPIQSALPSKRNTAMADVRCDHRRPTRCPPLQLLLLDDSPPSAAVISRRNFDCCGQQSRQQQRQHSRGLRPEGVQAADGALVERPHHASDRACRRRAGRTA